MDELNAETRPDVMHLTGLSEEPCYIFPASISSIITNDQGGARITSHGSWWQVKETPAEVFAEYDRARGTKSQAPVSWPRLWGMIYEPIDTLP